MPKNALNVRKWILLSFEKKMRQSAITTQNWITNTCVIAQATIGLVAVSEGKLNSFENNETISNVWKLTLTEAKLCFARLAPTEY